jgi:hypothetical protein
VTVFSFGGGAASLFLNKDLGFKEAAEIVHTLIGYPHLYGFDALVACRRIKIDAIAASMQISSAFVALVRNANFVHQLNFWGAIVAAGDQVEFCLDSSTGSFLTRWRFWLSFPVSIHIAGLSVFSGHFYLNDSTRLGKTGA